MTPKFDNYINTLLENEHEKKGMSTAKKAALGIGAAAALGGLGYLAGKKLGGNVGGKIGQLKGQVAGAAKDTLVNPGKQIKYGAAKTAAKAKYIADLADYEAAKVGAKAKYAGDSLVNVGKRGVSAVKDFGNRLVGMGRAAAGMKDKGYQSPKDIPLPKLSMPTKPKLTMPIEPDYKEFTKKLGAAGLKSGAKTGAGLGAVAGGTAGATAGAVGAHLATKDKKEKK